METSILSHRRATLLTALYNGSEKTPEQLHKELHWHVQQKFLNQVASRLCGEELITKQTVFRRTETNQPLQRTVDYTITDAGCQGLRESLDFYYFLGKNHIRFRISPAA